MEYYAVSAERNSFSDAQGYGMAPVYAESYTSDSGSEGYSSPNYPATPPYVTTTYPICDPGYAHPSAFGTVMPSAYSTDHIPIHSPVPVTGYSALLPPEPPAAPHSSQSVAQAPVAPSPPMGYLAPPPDTHQSSPFEHYINMPQVMFPTPCELLTNITGQEQAYKGPIPSDQEPQGASQPPSPALPTTDEKHDEGQKKPEKKPENQRKAYFRGVAENVGFKPTDPDDITSHDKKRHYLECLEQYVLWLHEQLRLVGHEPVPFERVPTYRGLSSRSIRTLLVHMQNETRALHQQKVEEEQISQDSRRAEATAYHQIPLESADIELRRYGIPVISLPHAPSQHQ